MQKKTRLHKKFLYTGIVPWNKVNVKKNRCGFFKLMLMHDEVKCQTNPANYRLFFNMKKVCFFSDRRFFFALLLLILMDCEGQEEIDPQRPVKVRSNLIRVVQIRNIF